MLPGLAAQLCCKSLHSTGVGPRHYDRASWSSWLQYFQLCHALRPSVFLGLLLTVLSLCAHQAKHRASCRPQLLAGRELGRRLDSLLWQEIE
ncbi:unnamed protein product [Chrysoparadoxa australica]